MTKRNARSTASEQPPPADKYAEARQVLLAVAQGRGPQTKAEADALAWAYTVLFGPTDLLST
jgi:hypothetical protein